MEVAIARPLDLSAIDPTDSALPVAEGVTMEQVDRFNARLREPGPMNSLEGASGAVEPYAGGVEGVESLGDAILRRMSAVGSHFRENWQSIADSVPSNGADVGIHDMLRFQLTMMTSAIETELLGKTIAKGEQSVEQLVKMQ